MIRNENSLLEMLVACAAECTHCWHECLRDQDVQNMTTCIRLNIDCAAICSLASSFVSGNSGFTENILTVCSTICDSCADQCGQHSKEYCRRCESICRRCAVLCRTEEKQPINDY